MTRRGGAGTRLIRGLIVVAAGLIVAFGVLLVVAYYAAPVTRPMATM
jgi:hypothetical protein